MIRLGSLILSIALLLGTNIVASGADTLQFTWRQDTPQPLSQSHSFLDYGTARAQGGCTFSPAARRLVSAASYVVRQLAVDFKRCVAITEEGIPGPGFIEPSAPRINSAPAERAAATTGSGKLARPLSAYTVSGWTKYTIANSFGQLLTSTEADITWSSDGSCVLSVSGGGTFTWASDWSLQPGGYYTTELSPCGQNSSFGYVKVFGTFQGQINTNCYHWYNPAAAMGRFDYWVDYGPYNISSNCGGWYLQMTKWNGVPG